MAEVKAYQGPEPTTDLTPGTEWYRDDGTWAVRQSNLSWIEMGSWVESNGGILSVNGGTVLDRILGSHALAELASPAFTGTPTINDAEMADKPWVSEELSTLQSELQSYIDGVISGASGATVSNLVGYGHVTVAHLSKAPLPPYPDGTASKAEEVKALFPSMSSMAYWSPTADTHPAWKVAVLGDRSIECRVDSLWFPSVGFSDSLTICER